MRLWEMVDGEPFFVNPQLLIAGANPRRKKKGKKMAVRRRKARRTRARRRTHRKNAPRRVRRSRRASHHVTRRRRRNPVMRRRRSRRGYRRNPSIMGFQLPPLMPVVYAGAGFIAPPAVEGFLAGFLPTEIATSTVGKYAVRLATVVGLTWLVGRFLGRTPATYFGIGGGAFILTSAIREFAPGVIPGLSAYTIPGVTAVPYTGMGAYTRPALGQGGSAFEGAMGIQRTGGTMHGSSSGVPARLRRLQ